MEQASRQRRRNECQQRVEGVRGGLNGVAGNDVLIGGAGDDTLNGGAGTDRCVADQGHDQRIRGTIS
jgi:hypothetical protein